MPIDILGVDAAILFADILTMPSAMGIEVKFSKDEGPFINNPIRSAEDVNRLRDIENLSYIEQTISIANGRLSVNIPLIGFAGAPFTVLCYLVEGNSSMNFTRVLKLMHNDPSTFNRLMRLLTKNTLSYLNLQKKAGIKAFQLFDTWGGILRPEDYKNFVLPYVQKIFEGVDLPSIYYLKNCAHLLHLMEESRADFLSVCHTVVFGQNLFLDNTKKGIQGNLYNGLLYAEQDVLEKELNNLLIHTRRFKKYIFNLSHGLFPDTQVEKVKLLVDKVHHFNWRLRKIK
jgi:uroporphyrinogen decarboxylase